MFMEFLKLCTVVPTAGHAVLVVCRLLWTRVCYKDEYFSLTYLCLVTIKTVLYYYWICERKYCKCLVSEPPSIVYNTLMEDLKPSEELSQPSCFRSY